MNDEPPYELTGEAKDAWIGLSLALGLVVVQWGLIEKQVDFWVERLFQDFDGKKLRKKGDRPRTLKPKNSFLSECFETMPELAELRPAANNIMSRVVIVSERRHDLIHGAISSWPKDGVFNFDKIDLPGYTLREFPASYLDVWEFAREVLSPLLQDAIAFSQKFAIVQPRPKE